MVKIYELTTNAKDGYAKYYVRGIRNNAEAKKWAKKVFGKEFYWASGTSLYDVTGKKGYGTPSMSKKQFLKLKKDFDRIQ